MSKLKQYHNLNDNARTALEISEKLNTKIQDCLKDLEEFLKEDDVEFIKTPAFIEGYKPLGYQAKAVKNNDNNKSSSDANKAKAQRFIIDKQKKLLTAMFLHIL